MPFAGLDVHKREVEAVVINDQGQITHRERFACNREQLVRFAKRKLGKDVAVALEATTNTWSVVEVLQPFAKEVVVSNPMRTRAIAEAKVKTDKIDALVLAKLLRADFLPRVWCPDEGTRERRSLVSRRASLVQDRTRVKNRIHAILHQRLIAPPVDDLFSTKGRKWLEQVSLDAGGRAALECEMRLLTQLEAELEELQGVLARNGYDDARVRLLITMPGVDVAVAQTLLAVLGDVTRFRDGDHAASYLGLVPSTKQSGDHCYHGPITKQGKGHARWILVQAAQHIGGHHGPLGVFFRRLLQKKNRNVAVVATARKLVTIAWHMLKNNEPYRYAKPRPTEHKLSRLRVNATGQKRPNSVPKSERGISVRRSGQPAIPVLNALYEREGIPRTAPLPKGEIRMLRDAHLLGLLEEKPAEQKPRGRKAASPPPGPEKNPKDSKRPRKTTRRSAASST